MAGRNPQRCGGPSRHGRAVVRQRRPVRFRPRRRLCRLAPRAVGALTFRVRRVEARPAHLRHGPSLPRFRHFCNGQHGRKAQSAPDCIKLFGAGFPCAVRTPHVRCAERLRIGGGGFGAAAGDRASGGVSGALSSASDPALVHKVDARHRPRSTGLSGLVPVRGERREPLVRFSVPFYPTLVPGSPYGKGGTGNQGVGAGSRYGREPAGIRGNHLTIRHAGAARTACPRSTLQRRPGRCWR